MIRTKSIALLMVVDCLCIPIMRTMFLSVIESGIITKDEAVRVNGNNHCDVSNY